MRILLLPGRRERRTVDQLLTRFFREYSLPDFRRAVSMMSRFYRLPSPPVAWFEYLDWGKTAGRTYENGNVHLVHPENWKNGRKYNSERQWIHTVYHEMGHYVLWADAERKADNFAYRFVRGVSDQGRATATVYALAESSRARRKRAGARRRAASRPRPLRRRRRSRSR
jgi:hypothetical protein